MQSIISVAIIVTLLTGIVIFFRWGHVRVEGTNPLTLFAFMAVLFTSGLDVGLIMLPLTEFPVYAAEAPYAFAKPIAIEFGFWGFLIWGFYFLSTFYFVLVEPRLKLFEIPWVKVVNNMVTIGTCAFTGFLFLGAIPNYIEGIAPWQSWALVALVVACACYSSSDLRFVEMLSVGSTWLFFALIVGMWLHAGADLGGFLGNLGEIGGYFANIHRFLTPISDYHAFYLAWWFAWSIMIGQFCARFVGNMSGRALMLSMLILPSIPLAIWFAVIYGYYTAPLPVPGFWKFWMVAVGVIFVINSLDSLIRLYSDDLNLTPQRFGFWPYMFGHFTLMMVLIAAYQFTPLKIEWIGMVVIFLYAVVYTFVFLRRDRLAAVPVQASAGGDAAEPAV